MAIAEVSLLRTQFNATTVNDHMTIPIYKSKGSGNLRRVGVPRWECVITDG